MLCAAATDRRAEGRAEVGLDRPGRLEIDGIIAPAQCAERFTCSGSGFAGALSETQRVPRLICPSGKAAATAQRSLAAVGCYCLEFLVLETVCCGAVAHSCWARVAAPDAGASRQVPLMP